MRWYKLFLISSFALMACRSHQSERQASVSGSVLASDSLQGKWSLIKRTGGFAGISVGLDSLNMYIQIDSDRITTWQNAHLIDKQRYKKTAGKAIESSEVVPLLELDNKKLSYIIAGDTLMLKDQCYDCFTYYYVRKKGQ